MNDKEIRNKILEFLQEAERNDPGKPPAKEQLVKELEIDTKTLDFNVNYLEDKRLVEVSRYLGGEYHINITAWGMDELEK